MSKIEDLFATEGAEASNLPALTLMRIWTLDRLHAEQDRTDVSVTERLARLEREVFSRTS